MTDRLAAVTRVQAPYIQRRFDKLGALQSVSFLGVGDLGWDVYAVKFANGVTVWRIVLQPDGKISSLLIQWGP